ncbi:sensor histidine kinase [Streptococcus oriscaviae]|uniref:histidine kinase n=1 Tax=Streptococcus oriscaviae TaxID=2781599 RepID=A0ABX7YNH0_9STRE|nr:sensor histidine kinase [Streptococcus oriscaviae]QUE55387.1 sensor histidine kinase [Streptococcus oriscaviae]
MKNIRSIRFSKMALIVINLVALVYNVSLYLYSTNYIVSKGASHSLLERLDRIPHSPTQVFFSTILLYALLLLVIFYRDNHKEGPSSIYDWLSLVEIVLMIAIFITSQSSYNGLILLVFADIFYNSKEFNTTRGKRYWLALVFFSFTALLISNYDILSLFVQLPSLDAFISFYPQSIKIAILFFKNFLVSLNMVVFIISLLSYIMYSITQRHNIEEELRMVSKVNTDLNSYVALTEKIVEDRERKRIAREIHDTLGHALTGISAGIDAVRVLVDLDPPRAKEQLQSMSVVVRDGIRDVRGSLNKLRPGALEDGSLKEALSRMVREYEFISHLKIELNYQWDKVDLDSMKENVVFRVIQESITNSLRHGHASRVTIDLLNQDKYIISIQDDGVGFDQLEYGYGLKHMRERLAILGGSVRFENRDGFFTWIEIPKRNGEMYD